MSKDRWTAEQVPGMEGKTVIITGCSSGIGFEAAKVLAGRGARVVMANRNMEKSEAAADAIRKEHPSAQLETGRLDLADLSSVRMFAQTFMDSGKSLDILVNNAGVMVPPYGKTKDGFELQMGTNHLGHFALTALLWPVLKGTEGSRVINVSSNAHQRGNPDLEDLHWEKRKYSRFSAYGDSKIANLLFTYELLRRTGGEGPLVLASHPGFTATELMRHSGPKSVADMIAGLFGMPQWQGALPTLRACVDPEAEQGDYYGPHAMMGWRGYPVKVASNPLSHDEKLAKGLWERSEKWTGVSFSV